MKGRPIPTYVLTEIQEKVRSGAFQITGTARKTSMALGFDESEVIACVLSLDRRDFYKSMESEMVPGSWQDVYRPEFLGEMLYVKRSVLPTGWAIVISFKEL